MREPNATKLQTIGTPDELNRMVEKCSPISDKQHRIASTGGSSLQNTEIIKSEVKRVSGSPSPSPPAHPQYPLMGSEMKDQNNQLLMQTLKQITPKNVLNQTMPIESKLVELPNVTRYD